MPYRSWDDYFRKKHDDEKPRFGAENLMEDIDDFERGYKNRFGAYLDHHMLNLIKKYGHEKAWDVINSNIQTLNNEKNAAAKAAEHEYVFHPVPEGETVPF
ncbi:MAG: hypothetical protein NC489_31040 [Ruminococcus flavefaciens]|nr:hypothetical protein [Ruminococcus flavefaciens]